MNDQQSAIVDAITIEHGFVRVLSYFHSTILAQAVSLSGKSVGPWWYITETPRIDLRPASGHEVEQALAFDLLTRAGLIQDA